VHFVILTSIYIIRMRYFFYLDFVLLVAEASTFDF
jgi:hypothetical protein